LRFDDRMSFLGGGRACMYVLYLFHFCMVCSFFGNSGYRFAAIEISTPAPSFFDVDTNHCSFIEIIVTMLLDNFKFSLSDDEIVWKLANIQMPWVEGQEAKGPSMPLTVERL